MTDHSSAHLTEPVFVVGVPRSGTTLVSSLLSSSSELVMAPELHFLTEWRNHYGFLDLTKEADSEFFIGKFVASERFALLEISEQAVRMRVSALRGRSFGSVLSVLLDEYRVSKGKVRVGEKTPGQFICVPELLRSFPDARVVWLVRDPRAVISSLLLAPFASPFIGHKARRWNQAQKLLQNTIDQRVLQIRYEDLITDSAATVTKLAEFTNLTLPPDAATSPRPSSVGATTYDHIAWGNEHRHKAMQPVSPTSLSKWQTGLTPLQIAMVDVLTGDVAQQYGYEPHTNDLAPTVVHDAIRKEQRKYYRSRLLPTVRSRLVGHPALRKWEYKLTGTTRDIIRQSAR